MDTLRRYDIDWLRVITLGLLIIYHIAACFQPFARDYSFMKNEPSMEAIWYPMTMINLWRIPILFFISGMGVCFAMRKRNWKQLIFERARRILVPLIFGAFCIVPIHIALYLHYYQQELYYAVHQGHLWFLYNIFVYVLLFLPIFLWSKRFDDKEYPKLLIRLIRNPLTLLLILTLPFVVEVTLIKPEYFVVYAMNDHGFWLGFIAFFFGFWFVKLGKIFWDTIVKWQWLFFSIVFVLYCIRFTFFNFDGPLALNAIESVCSVLFVLSMAYKYLNFNNKLLRYLSQSSYPVYIIHMAIQYGVGYWLLPLSIHPLLEFFVMIICTFLGCFMFYEFCIRRIRYIRPLFGLNLDE